jgi:DNA primase
MASTPVEQIKEKLSILDVVGQYVELKHAGKSYKGKSPFTNEKTPSFYVSPERGMYYCFSSQQGGDMFTFVEKMEGVDFKGALKILAEKAHVELVPEDPQKRDARETQYALLEEATKYFWNAREEHPQITAYIEKRGVKVQTMHTWRIGYAKDEWRSLKNHLKEKGFTEEQMLKAGLIKNADQGKEAYDVFRDRVMFPIFDSGGRVVAFSGRTLKTESGIPKYVNSPETELFVKSEVMYGYDKAKNGIRHFDFSLIVEGQFDLVLAHQAGYTNTVAVSGTALTKHHIMLLLRLSKNAVLSLDADRAGVSAVKRSALPMLLSGMDVKVAHMPEGMDPADMVREDPQGFKKVVGGAVHVVEFLLRVLKQNGKDERTYKLRVREEVLPLLTAIDNRIDREHFEGICAEYLGATKDAIHFEVERLIETQKHSPQSLKSDIKTEVPVKSEHSRKELLFAHMRAFIEVLVGEQRWIRIALEKHLATILGARKDAMLSEIGTQDTGTVFQLEEKIEGLRERDIIVELEDTLHAYAKLVAKERLAELRMRIRVLEDEGKHDDAMTLLQESKQTEELLQMTFTIQK